MKAKSKTNHTQDRRAAALRENLRKRKEQSRLRETQNSRDKYMQANANQEQSCDTDNKKEK